MANVASKAALLRRREEIVSAFMGICVGVGVWLARGSLRERVQVLVLEQALVLGQVPEQVLDWDPEQEQLERAPGQAGARPGSLRGRLTDEEKRLSRGYQGREAVEAEAATQWHPGAWSAHGHRRQRCHWAT